MDLQSSLTLKNISRIHYISGAWSEIPHTSERLYANGQLCYLTVLSYSTAWRSACLRCLFVCHQSMPPRTYICYWKKLLISLLFLNFHFIDILLLFWNKRSTWFGYSVIFEITHITWIVSDALSIHANLTLCLPSATTWPKWSVAAGVVTLWILWNGNF